MESLAKELATPMSGSLGRLKTSSLPPAVRNAINGLDIGRPSGPVRNENGLAILMVCDRQGGQNAEQEQREQIERMLTLQRLDAAAQRYLRDLRRAAFIDLRL
jgi:peptidyl-prolyl cis-trans isomerase SurA